uniref:Uncharacterized protein n=1 Tax=Arundo donax TaxID=35708 RepID=A0A0A9ARM3_ARUDO
MVTDVHAQVIPLVASYLILKTVTYYGSLFAGSWVVSLLTTRIAACYLE